MAILFSGTIYYFLEESLLQDFDDALFNYSVDVAQTIEIGPKEDLLFPTILARGSILSPPCPEVAKIS